MAFTVCFSDNPGSSGNNTACAVLNSSAYAAVLRSSRLVLGQNRSDLSSYEFSLKNEGEYPLNHSNFPQSRLILFHSSTIMSQFLDEETRWT